MVTNNQGGNSMKTTYLSNRSYYACRCNTGSRYPNSATRKYFLGKLLDTALAAAITVAVVAILLFVLILF